MFLSTFAENNSLNLLCYKKPRFWAFLLRCGLEVYAVCHSDFHQSWSFLVTKVTDLRQNWSLSQGGTLTQMADFHPNWPLPPGEYQIFIKIYHFGKGVTLTKVTDSVTMNNPWACFRLFYWTSCCFVAVLLKFCNLVQQFFWCPENLFFGVPTNQPTFSGHVPKICVLGLPYI